MYINNIFKYFIIGIFKDWTGTYDMSFYLSGVLLVTSAVICYPLRKIKKWEDKKKLQRDAI